MNFSFPTLTFFERAAPWALAAMVAVALYAGGYQTGKADVQQKWDLVKTRDQLKVSVAMAAASAAEQAAAAKATKVINDYNALEAQAQQRVGAADDELGRMRQLVTALAARPVPADPAAARAAHEAAAARDSAAECAGRHIQVAAAHDAISRQLTALQGWVRAQCQAPPEAP